MINGTGAVAFSTDAKFLATLSQESPQVNNFLLNKFVNKC